ncbi:MAG: Crp/Fnr family transcriptional regulator [Clostridia bacterium]|nr:Crp/Fnr family transcriptional regulator [Clostridia bacterium]
MMKGAIEKNPLFSGLDDNECEDALAALSAIKQEYAKGAVIFHAGERMYRFGLVLCGTVQVSFTDIDGNEILMASADAGDTFGESLCWLKVAEAPVTVTASTDVTLLWLTPELLMSGDTRKIVQELRNRFLSMLAAKTLSMNERVQILSKPTIRLKLITFLSQYANRYGSKTFSVPYDRETLARYLGVNRTALSRELSAMQADGIIEFYKNSFKILK